jgi:hypothetical protein
MKLIIKYPVTKRAPKHAEKRSPAGFVSRCVRLIESQLSEK